MGRNVFELLSKLPKHGVGAKLTRQSWKKGSYWEVSEVKMALDGKHGQVWGRLTWNEAIKNEQPTQINGPLKKVWKVLDAPKAQRQQRWGSLAAAALRKETAAAAAAEAAEATAAAAEPAAAAAEAGS